MTEANQLMSLIADKTRVTARVGLFRGVQSGQALVDMGGERFPAQFLTRDIPVLNDPVHVWSVDGSWFMVGVTAPQPRVGTVLTVSLPRCTVDTSFGSVPAIVGGDAPASGDRVLLTWTEDGPVTGLKLATTPDQPDVPPDPGGGGTVKEVIFRAVDAGSTDRGSARWWQAQPWASNTTYGAWFYGTQIKDTVPSGSTFVSLEFYVNRVQDTGGAPRFALHSSPVKAGVPSFAAYTEWDPSNGWHSPPDPSNWFTLLTGGGDRYGVGLNQGGYSRFAALAEDGMSGALRIKWR